MIECMFEDGNKGLLRHVVVDAVVTKDQKVLMVKRAGRLLEGGKWALTGGYVERDETVEQAAAREILEETGWKVEGLTLLRIKDNPDRPHEDRQNIGFVYYCAATEKVGEPDDESDEQKWFDWSNLPPNKEIAFDHAEDIVLYQKHIAEQS